MDNFQQGGRYIMGTLFPSFEDGAGVGAHLTYLPPNCKLRYFSSTEANTCLQKVNVTLIGDSTTRETTQELILHLTAQPHDRGLFENPYNCMPGHEHCYKNREYGYSIPTAPGKPKSFINQIWGATKFPCDNGHGLIDLINDHTFLDFTKFKISYPEFCHEFSTTMGYSAKEWGTKGGKWARKILRETDVLIFTAGQHDMDAMAHYPKIDYHLRDYEDRLDFVMSQLAPLARTRVFVATSPQVGRQNFMNRYLNTVAKRVAKKNGFLFLDQNGSMIHRLTGEGKGMTGDWIHAFQRTVFTAANVQLILNVICPK
ncbi:hypothetical protein HDU99_001474 [Rhizoclosmatium hyalinum]|nr:hypothetical protein HDU99_001474 [Rhizoclosmatium hyalinum]